MKKKIAYFIGWILILEVLLQLTAFAVQVWNNQSKKSANVSSGTFNILCLGESTTGLGWDSSYPRILERKLAIKSGSDRYKVINAGMPGKDTNDILDNIDSLIAHNNPSLGILMVGINDYWNLPDREMRWWEKSLEWMSGYSRIAKIIRLTMVNIKAENSISEEREVFISTCNQGPKYSTPEYQSQKVLEELVAKKITSYDIYLNLSLLYRQKNQIQKSIETLKLGISRLNSYGYCADSYLLQEKVVEYYEKDLKDPKKALDQIEEFLKSRGISEQKYQLMLSSFSQISKDEQRDEPMENDKEVAKLLSKPSSTNKQVFTFIYENIFKSIDGFGGHIDMMGELYSEFLKYALGDGKELGIVLTPPYVTKLMAQILGINSSNRVMDLATGSAGFLISAMELMIDDAQKQFGKGTTKANELITQIKQNQLLGVELNAEMYTLAATNMILRGDGSSKIEKGSAFNRPDSLFTDFKADRILLNPPFSYDENGMPFIAYGLDKMEKGGLGAIIIQDSAGSGKAVSTNQKILKKHSLLASIKMPTDLFQPMAGVQTSIYIFEAHKPHDIDNIVKFIDFSNDGYKRTERSLSEIDHPVERYADMLKIYKAGKNAKVTPDLWNLADIYVEDFITLEGNDWNFTQHKKIDTKPTLADFKKTVADYLAWEVSKILVKGEDNSLGK